VASSGHLRVDTQLMFLWREAFPVNPSNHSWRPWENGKTICEYKCDGLTESPGKSQKEGQEASKQLKTACLVF